MTPKHSLNLSTIPICRLLPFGKVLLLCGMVGCQSAGQQITRQYDVSDAGASYSGDQFVGSSVSQSGIRPCGGEICERPDDFGRAAVPAPPGTYVNDWNDAMIFSARQQDFVISRHEWFSGGGQLGPAGRQHVTSIAQGLLQGRENVIIETEPTELRGEETLDEALARTADLNEQRRRDVVAMLRSHGVPDAEQQVILAPIDRVGVRGIEAPRVYNQLLQGGRRGQQGMGNSGRGAGGFGGGGFGGGASGGGGFF